MSRSAATSRIVIREFIRFATMRTFNQRVSSETYQDDEFLITRCNQQTSIGSYRMASQAPPIPLVSTLAAFSLAKLGKTGTSSLLNKRIACNYMYTNFKV